ncbi:MAG TPA: PDZ domain-containing protein [Burkholderiaceae bacterium]|nr:PDZ domain-containing protein [Burkholderiaceae bacterium]
MSVQYAIRPADPAAHLFHVVCRVERPDPQGQLFMLPAWAPGSYMVREFARHIVRISAVAGRRKLPLTKLDKHTWRAAPVKGPLEVACEVYAWDQSVRAAHLDETHGFFNGTSVFLLPIGHEHSGCSVDILPPAGDRYAHWKVITGLTPARATRRLGFGTYLAANYEELIDCPVEMGAFELGRFDVLGVPHEIAVTGRVPRLDMQRLTTDLAVLCEQQIRLFEPRSRRAPFARYAFMTLAVGDGYGGLEHRNSTALICKRDDLPYAGMKDSTEGYRTFLGLASHEYFHSWNVKRIRPAAFVPYDLTQENYTRLLWAFEGFTSYYDDLMLVRAGLLTPTQYLETVTRTMTTVMQRSSRLKQSVADSSFDAWIKYYRQDENAPNSVVSYYQKGALVGLALDLAIRAQTKGRRSLDDVMRLLWRRYRTAGADYGGVDEDELATVADEATGLALAPLLDEWTQGTRDPDFARLLQPFGIEFAARPALDSPTFALLGVRIAAGGSDCALSHVHDGTPAQSAGLSAHDVLVALDGLRVTATNLDRLLARHAPGDSVEVLAFRRDELMRFTLRLAERPPLRWTLSIDPKATPSVARLRAQWLGQR